MLLQGVFLALFGFLQISESFMLEDSRNSEEVYINLIESRDDSNTKRLEFTYKNKPHSIPLTPGALPVTPNFFVTREHGKGKSHMSKPNIKQMQKELYENAALMSSVRITSEAGSATVEGLLSHGLGIKPNLESKRSEDGSISHVVFDIPAADRQNIRGVPNPAAVAMHEHQNLTMAKSHVKRQNKCFNVEMLLVSDFKHYSDIGDEDGVTWYCVIHANSAKLLYETIPDPQTRLVVIGVVINKSPDAEPYVTKNLRENGKYLSEKALGDFKDYFNANMQDYKYDTAYLFTGRDFAFEDENGNINGGLLGLAWVATACTDLRYGVGEDNPGGSYMIVNVLAHELGHNLGDDGCSDSPLPNDKRGMPRFGPCPIEKFKKYMYSDQAECLTRAGYIFYKDDSVPGERITADRRCQLLSDDPNGIVSLRPNDAKPCFLYCGKDGNVYRTWDALDGRDCGDGKVCWMGDCTQRGKVPWLCGSD